VVDVVLHLDFFEFSFHLLFRKAPHQICLVLHVVVPIEGFVDSTIPLEESAQAFALIIAKLAFKDFFQFLVVVSANSHLLVVLEVADVDLLSLSVEEFTFLAMHFILHPSSFEVAAVKENVLSKSVSLELLNLAIVNITERVQQLGDWHCAAFPELTFINYHRRQEELRVFILELIVSKLALVNTAVAHDHLAYLAHVILPGAFEAGSICPDHRALALPFSVLEITFVLCDLVLIPDSEHGNRVFIVDAAVSIGPPILEHPREFISIGELHGTLVLKAPVRKLAG